MDERQKKFHEHISPLTITLIISVSGILEIPQANYLLPLLNQFWTLALPVIDKLHKWYRNNVNYPIGFNHRHNETELGIYYRSPTEILNDHVAQLSIK